MVASIVAQDWQGESRLAQVLHDYTGQSRRRWQRIFPYNRTVGLSALAFVAGIGLVVPLVVSYARSGLAFSGLHTVHYLAVTGIMLMILAFTTFTFTLMLNAATLVRSELGDGRAG